MCSRTGGDNADQRKHTTNNNLMQELAAAGPSAIQACGPEPGEAIRVEFSGPGKNERVTFLMACGGLFAPGGHDEK